MSILDEIALIGIVPVVKIQQEKDAVAACAALRDGGLPIAEITFRTEAAEESIRRVSGELPDVLVGAGTVLSVEQAKRAAGAGAKFMVSPGFNDGVVRFCVDNGIPVIPGCSNPSDIERALERGLRTVKFFPAQTLGGVAAIKAMSAPYGDVKFLPTGGVNPANMLDYLALPQVAAIGGSWMIADEDIASGNFDAIRQLTSAAVDKLLGFAIAHIGINAKSAQDAGNIGSAYANLFNWRLKEGNTSFFAGTAIEVNKNKGRGEMGHIAIATNDLRRAQAYLTRKGASFDPDSIKYGADGRPSIVYFSQEIGEFAMHLTQR